MFLTLFSCPLCSLPAGVGGGEPLSPPDASCHGILFNPSPEKKKKSQVAMTETGPQAQSSPSSCYVRVLGTTDTQEGVGGSEEL